MKLELKFKPAITSEIEIDDKNFLFNAAPLTCESVPEQQEIVENALNKPIGTPPLQQMLKPDMQLVLLVDDITRPTPTAKLLPPVLARIEQAGIPDSNIKIIMAPGTHRPMTDEELEIKLSRPVMDRYTILNRDYPEADKFITLEPTPSGVPIEVDREVYEADFVIGFGNIIPHISAGWSGGAKIILPGVCSARSTDMMHYKACVAQYVLDILGTSDNIPRKEMEVIAGKVGLDFIVNTVLDEHHNMQGVFCGHFIDAHTEGARLATELMIVPIPRQADICIVSANPSHFDYWQGIKPYAYAHRAVREGGVLIFLLDGGEGLCGDAPTHDSTLRKYMQWDFDDMVAEVEAGRATDIVGMNVPMYHAVLRHRVTNLIVSNHMTDEDIDVLGFERCTSAQQALERAYAIVGNDAKVGVIPYGGETLTRVNWKDFKALNSHMPERTEEYACTS